MSRWVGGGAGGGGGGVLVYYSKGGARSSIQFRTYHHAAGIEIVRHGEAGPERARCTVVHVLRRCEQTVGSGEGGGGCGSAGK